MIKNKLISIIFLVIALAAFSCMDKKEKVVAGDSDGAATASDGEASQSAQPDSLSAIIIRQGARFVEEPGGKTIGQLDIGTEVSYFPGEDIQADDKYKTVYRHIRTAKADEGYVASYYVIENARPMLVVEDAPRLTGLDPFSYSTRGHVIYRGTLVAVKKMYPTGVAQISYANMSTNYAMGTQYINSAYLVDMSADMLATYQAFLTAYQMNNKDSKSALLDAISGDSSFYLNDEINSLIYSLTAEAPLPVPMEVGTQILVSEDGLNVRSGPSSDSDSAGKLLKGTQLVITDVSSGVDKIGSNTDYWYEVERLGQSDGPRSGWIYGAFVQESLGNNNAAAEETTEEPIATEGREGE